jgi:hypothetical protein
MDGLGKGEALKWRAGTALRLTGRTSSAPFWIIRSMESLTNVLAVNRERSKFISSSATGNGECKADLESISGHESPSHVTFWVFI